MSVRAQLLSPLYRGSRKLFSTFIPRDYESVILTGHWVLKHLGPLEPILTQFAIPPNLTTSFYDINFPSPLILAAFEGDFEIVKLWTQFGLGGATLKTVLQDPLPGNPRPRIQRVFTPEGEGLINAMGLPGKGLSNLITSLDSLTVLPKTKPLGFSIGGHSLDEYKQNALTLLHAIAQHPTWKTRPYFIEINISCPNTPQGQSMLAHPELLQDLLTTLKTTYPNVIIGPKLSPDQTNKDLLIFGKLVQAFPKTFLTLGNTQFRKCEQVHLPTKAISIGGGGLSGPALFSRTLEMTQLLAPLGLPIIATGGISSSKQVQTLQNAGATLIGMATAVVQDPYIIPIILETLSRKDNMR